MERRALEQGARGPSPRLPSEYLLLNASSPLSFRCQELVAFECSYRIPYVIGRMTNIAIKKPDLAKDCLRRLSFRCPRSR